MKLIGITGGIGSGKSVVSLLLEAYHIPVYCADRESKRLTFSSPVIREHLTALLGQEIYTNKGLNRSLMASLIFRDAALLEKVNGIIHPEVSRDFDLWRERLHTPACAMESAILFESGFDKKMDVRLMVYAPEELRIRRVMERDGLSESDVRNRMNRQWSDERKKELSDITVLNDGKTPLIPQIDKLIMELGIG